MFHFVFCLCLLDTLGVVNGQTLSNIITREEFHDWSDVVPRIVNGKLDCSPQLARAQREIARGLATGSKRNVSQPFMEPVLHACLAANPYNTRHLPRLVGSETKDSPLQVKYNFFFNSLLALESCGTIVLRAFLRLEWHDQMRGWDKQAFGIDKIKVPLDEVWTPVLQVANCITDNCYILPFNRSTVGLEHTGQVTLGMQLYIKASCDVSLIVRSPFSFKIHFYSSSMFRSNLINIKAASF